MTKVDIENIRVTRFDIVQDNSYTFGVMKDEHPSMPKHMLDAIDLEIHSTNVPQLMDGGKWENAGVVLYTSEEILDVKILDK